MLRETVGHLRDIPRYRQILATLVRYGYRDVVTSLHLEGLVRPFERAALGDEVPPRERPRRLRLVCEDLGPTFVKLGQLLSTRPDILPDAYIQELAGLRDEVRPFGFATVEEILAQELGRPPEEVFRSIDPEPVASASISQVHRAFFQDGSVVALKIRRPGIEKTVQADLDILKNLSQLAEKRLPFLAPYGPAALAREFERSLKRELDLGVELRTMERCRVQLRNDPTVHVPQVYREYSSPRVLVMEFIGGVGVDDREGLRRLGVNPAEVAGRGAQLLLKQIFALGLFHADPHPGNLRVLPGGVIVPLDYGLFGQLDTRLREQIADLIIALLGQDTDGVLRALDELEIRGAQVDARAFRRDVGELVNTYSDLSLDTIDLAKLLGELVALIRTHRLRIPPDLVLLIRSLVTIESVGRNLDPHFDIGAQAEPFLRQLALRRYHPRRLLARSIRTGDDLRRIATLLPELLSHALESVRRDGLTVRFDLQHFENLVRQLTRTGNNLACGIIIAGLIVGSSLLVHTGLGPVSLGYCGFLAAAMLGIWLMASVLRNP